MKIKRQNFGVTCLKNNPNNEKNCLNFIKVVVAGGWSGKHYLNSIEI